MRTERGLDRFVTFIDAVVAIASTLLVLPLVDVLGGAQAGRDLASVFSDEAGRFVTFFLSFALIARLWLAHHPIVEGVGAYDDAFLLATLAWSLTIVLVPFATPGGRQLPAGAAGGPGLHRDGDPQRGLPGGDRTAGLAPAGAAPGRRRAAGPAPGVAGDQRGVGRGPAAGDAVPGGELLGPAAAGSDCADRVVATSQPALHVKGPPRLGSWPHLSPSLAVLTLT